MTTKYLKIAAALLVGVSGLNSCSELELDQHFANQGGTAVSAEQKNDVVAVAPERMEAAVTGAFSAYGVFNQMGGDRHNDFGYPAIMLALEHRGQDLVGLNTGYNWFNYYLDYEDIDYSYYMVNYIWGPLYNQIKAANDVCALVSGETAASDAATDDLKFYRAQGVAARAFSYFNLAQLFQFTYKGNESKPCVPLILDTNADEAAANGCARSTVQQVYDQILADLNEAVTLLTGNSYQRADKRYIDLYTAKGLRARVYLVMNMFDEAKADAQDVINNGGFTPLSLDEAGHPGFNNLEEGDNIMWGVKMAETDRAVTTGICNFPSHMGSLNYGYATVGAWRMVNKALYNSIPATDVRKNWFLDADGKSAGLTPQQQAYVTGQGAPAYTQVKFAPYKGVVGTTLNASDIPLMRVEEMYYIVAEAEAQSGSTTTLTNFVKTYRDPSFAPSGDAKEVVWNQRRVEFFGEGLSYFDLQRLKKPVDRRGGGYEPDMVFNIPADDAARIYPIPMSEINANKLISDADNNPTASLPKPVADK